MTRHRFDPFSFLAGGVAVAAAVLVLIGDVTVRLVDLRVIGPVLVLALGLALLFGGRRDRDEVVAAPAGSDPLTDDDGPAWHELDDDLAVDDGADPIDLDEPGVPTQPIDPDERTATQRIEDEPRASTQRIEPEEIHTERIRREDDR